MELQLCLVGSWGIPGAIPHSSPLSSACSTEAGSSVGCFHGIPAAFQRQGREGNLAGMEAGAFWCMLTRWCLAENGAGRGG